MGPCIAGEAGAADARGLMEDSCRHVERGPGHPHSEIEPPLDNVPHAMEALPLQIDPEGFLGVCDSSDQRFDSILEDFECREWCVDDTVFWDRKGSRVEP